VCVCGFLKDLLELSGHRDEVQIKKDIGRVLLKKPQGVRQEAEDT